MAPDLTEEQRARFERERRILAYHEAGHAAVSQHYGYDVQHVSIDPGWGGGGDGRGECRATCPSYEEIAQLPIEERERQTFNLMRVAFAGDAAVLGHLGQRCGNGIFDELQAGEIASHCLPDDEKTIEQRKAESARWPTRIDELRAETADLLSTPALRRLVEALASALIQHQRLDRAPFLQLARAAGWFAAPHEEGRA